MQMCVYVSRYIYIELSMWQIPSMKKVFIFLIDSLALLFFFLFYVMDQLYCDGAAGCFG